MIEIQVPLGNPSIFNSKQLNITNFQGGVPDRISQGNTTVDTVLWCTTTVNLSVVPTVPVLMYGVRCTFTILHMYVQ